MRHKQVDPSQKRKRVLRLIREANLRLKCPDNRAQWPGLVGLFKEAVDAVCNAALHQGLEDDLERLFEEHRRKAPFKFRHERFDNERDYLILVEVQIEELQRELERVRKAEQQMELERNEGVTGEDSLSELLTRDPAVKERNQRKRAAWRQRRALAERHRDADLIRRHKDRLRHRAPGAWKPTNWFAPMTRADYSRATGQIDKTIDRFLRAKGCKPTAKQERRGPGRRARTYSFEANLAVLEQWLTHWLPQEPNVVANAIRDTAFNLACWDDPDQRHHKIRALLRSRWHAVIDRVTDQEILADRRFWEQRALGTAAAWERFRAGVAAWMRQQEEAERRPPPDSYAMLASLGRGTSAEFGDS